MLDDRRLGSALFLNRLREMRMLEGVAAFSGIVELLAHLDLAEAEAEQLLAEILSHRDAMTRELGRDPGIPVAAMDYLTGERKLLRNPTVVDFSVLNQGERYSTTDPLTDLLNQVHFERALEIEIRRSRRYGLRMALLILDLDSFASVNDVYGHPFGDRVLRRTGQWLRRAVRESDTAGRLQGERFGVVLPETDRWGVLAAGERVRKSIEAGFADAPIDGRLVAMTISGGAACLDEDGSSLTELIHSAERALERAKLFGANRIVVHHAEKRRHQRHATQPTVCLRMLTGSDEPAQWARVVDLSAGGALLEASGVPSRPPSELVLSWQVVGETFETSADLARVEPDATPNASRFAVTFRRLLPEAILAACIHPASGRSRDSRRPA